MAFEIQYPRVIAERRPDGHQPAAPRYSLRWEQPLSTLVSVYFGIQRQSLSWDEEKAFHEFILGELAKEAGTATHEILRCTDEAGWTNGIVVAYWTDVTQYERWHATSQFRQWFESPERRRGSTGYWCETICVPYDRHETIYSAGNYRVGLGRLAGTEIVPITTNGYFGAARDRLPISAIDHLESPHGTIAPPKVEPVKSYGELLVALVPHNATFLRSGQHWEAAGPDQLDDYLHSLQPKLLRGMRYLTEHRERTGCLSLRIMTNLNADGSSRAETSVAAMFLSMSPLESWAASHETHLDIYRHAIAMNRKYKEKREVVTWHELFVLPRGNLFEYVNCHPETGLLPYARLRPV